MINRKDGKTMDLNLENAIPINVLKDELYGLRAEYQCDIGGMYAIQKIKAIENVLNWFETPDYQRRLGHSGFKKESKAIDIKPGDKIYIPIYDDMFPDESFVGEDEVFDVGEKGIYLNCDASCAEFLGFDEVGKTFFISKQEAEKELLCIIARK